MKLESSPRIFEKILNIKFHENPFIGSHTVVCGRKDGRTDRHTADITKLIVAFSQFCERPSNCYLLTSFVLDLRMLRNLYTIRLLYNITVSATCFCTNRTQVSTCCFLCTIEYREGFIDTDGFWTE